jgi:two-component system phosphate regulon response regulator PhoB
MAHVVVIEDEPAVRRIIQRVLARDHHTVREAASGGEAVRICQQDGIDLLICDIGIPEMSGYQVARHCRISCPQCGVVLISGDLPDEVERSKVPGDVQYLQKPFAPQQLVEAVNVALGDHRRSG